MTPAESKLFCDSSYLSIWGPIKSPNFKNLFWGEFDLRHSKGRASVCAPFILHVGHVLFVWACPKVRRVYTQLIVSSRAVVANLKSFRHWPFVNDVRNDVRTHGDSFAVFPMGEHHSVMSPFRKASTDGSRPKPARIGFLDVLPKSLNGGGIKSLLSEVLGRYGKHVVRFARRALQGPAGFSFSIRSPIARQALGCGWW